MFLEPPIERTLVSLYDSVMGVIDFEVVVVCSFIVQRSAQDILAGYILEFHGLSLYGNPV